MKTQIVALIASLILASSVFAAAPATTEHKDAKAPVEAAKEEAAKEENKETEAKK